VGNVKQYRQEYQCLAKGEQSAAATSQSVGSAAGSKEINIGTPEKERDFALRFVHVSVSHEQFAEGRRDVTIDPGVERGK
jgi:hypothetical protein